MLCPWMFRLSPFTRNLKIARWVENCLIWLTLGMLLAGPIADRGQQSPTANRSLASEAVRNRAAVVANYGNLPLSFEANQGQTELQVRFLSRGDGYSLFLTDTAATLALTKRDASLAEHDQAIGLENNPASTTGKTDVVRMELTGTNQDLHVAGDDNLAGIANYFIGDDPANWHRNVPTYGKVRYSGVYPGIELIYYGNQHQGSLAEGEGFEPPVPSQAQRFSRPPVSTAHPSLRLRKEWD
jgi:hypothetical protein